MVHRPRLQGSSWYGLSRGLKLVFVLLCFFRLVVLISFAMVQIISTGYVFAANGIHALTFGNGQPNQDTGTLFMTAGLGNETRGMFVILQAAGCPTGVSLSDIQL